MWNISIVVVDKERAMDGRSLLSLMCSTTRCTEVTQVLQCNEQSEACSCSHMGMGGTRSQRLRLPAIWPSLQAFARLGVQRYQMHVYMEWVACLKEHSTIVRASCAFEPLWHRLNDADNSSHSCYLVCFYIEYRCTTGICGQLPRDTLRLFLFNSD
jgi:hypothetical protein